MFVVERLSTHLRPGKAEDGPPYGKPGTVWNAITEPKATRAEAEASMAHILEPMLGESRRDPARYRVREVRIASLKTKRPAPRKVLKAA